MVELNLTKILVLVLTVSISNVNIMNIKNLIYILICIIFLGGCSASYKELSIMDEIKSP